MRFVVLGGTGYLGSRLLLQLRAQGHDVLCVKRGPSVCRALRDALPDSCFVAAADLPQALAQGAPYDCMLNFCCRYVRPDVQDTDIFEANLCAPLAVFLQCLAQGVRRFLTVGTSLPPGLNAYTLSKTEFANILRWYAQQREHTAAPISVCHVLLENFYGEDEPKDRFLPGTLDRLFKNEPVLLTSGEQRRDFIYIDDVVACFMALLARRQWPAFAEVPIGTGESVPVRQLIEYLKELAGSRSELRFGALPKRVDEPNTCADRAKMEALGLRVQYDWKSGLQKFVERARECR